MKTLDELTNGGRITQAIRDYYAQFGLRPCSGCREIYPIEDFTTDRGKTDDIGHVCMSCRVKRNRGLKEYKKEYDAVFYQENKPEIRSRQTKHNEKHKDRRTMRAIMSRALKDKTLIKPKKCSRCTNTDRIEGHHPDYNKPLNVIWLCKSCHRVEHARINKREELGILTDCVATT